MKKKALLSILALGTFISLTALGANQALAEDDEIFRPVMQRLAERFNLNEDEVEAVFEAVHEERQDQMRLSQEEKLNQAVADGVITEEQKNAILEKHQQMWQEREQERQNHFVEMDEWFDALGVDHEALMEYMGGFGPRGGRGGFGGRGN